MPSVTEIVGIIAKPYLDSWKRKIGFEEADRIMNEAASLGRETHDMVDEFLKTGFLSGCNRSERSRKLFDSWFKWWEKSGYNLIVAEKHLVSIKHKFHGSADCFLQ